jgi:hypothetical protein
LGRASKSWKWTAGTFSVLSFGCQDIIDLASKFLFRRWLLAHMIWLLKLPHELAWFALRPLGSFPFWRNSRTREKTFRHVHLIVVNWILHRNSLKPSSNPHKRTCLTLTCWMIVSKPDIDQSYLHMTARHFSQIWKVLCIRFRETELDRHSSSVLWSIRRIQKGINGWSEFRCSSGCILPYQTAWFYCHLNDIIWLPSQIVGFERSSSRRFRFDFEGHCFDLWIYFFKSHRHSSHCSNSFYQFSVTITRFSDAFLNTAKGKIL